MPKKATRVLVVQTDPEIRDAICELMKAEGYEAVPVRDLASALTLVVDDDALGSGFAHRVERAAPERTPDALVAEAAAAREREAPAPAPPAAGGAPAVPPSAFGGALDGLVHVCSWCKRVRRMDGAWASAADHAYPGRPRGRGRWQTGRLVFNATHGICQDCLAAAAL